MFKNYLTIAIRHLLRHKVYSLINIVGLAIGMACCLLIVLYVHHEVSYDRFHDKVDRIYRVIPTGITQDGTTARWAVTPAGMATHLLHEFPEIICAVRIDGNWVPSLKHGSKRLKGYGFTFADSSFFTMFSFPLLKGNPQTALRDPFSLVLTETTARTLFGNDNPLGKIITYDSRFDFTVTGIVQNAPPTSNLQFSYLASFVSLKDIIGGKENALENYTNSNYYTYLLLPEHYPPSELEKKLPGYVKKYLGGDVDRSDTRLSLQPITEIHLDPAVQFDWQVVLKGDRRTISIFSAIALFVLVIACINFINLATARSAIRAREVGMRKVLGAHRFQLIRQFIGESLVVSFLALLLAVALIEVFLPVFNDLAGRHVVLDYGNRSTILAGFLGIGMFVGVVAGSYPAVYLSAFHPVSVLKSGYKTGAQGAVLRRGLVVMQFTIAIVLIIGTIIVSKQFHFMKAQDLGFDKEHVMFSYGGRGFLRVKPELLQNPHILGVAAANAIPGHVGTKQSYHWFSEGGENGTSFWTIVVDPDYLETLGFTLVAGRNFSWEIASDEKEAYLLNEAAVRELGWDPASAIGKEFRVWDHGKGRVIGVVKDFHFQSLRHPIEPLVMRMDPGWLSMAVIRIAPEDVAGTVKFLKQKWEKLSPDWPFTYEFLDTDFDRLYKAEEKQNQIFGYFSLLAIVIACLGLFGLASFTAEQRTKEIGIRKVLGASVTSIVLLLSKEFTKLVLVANIIAWPIAYYAMNQWLQDFAYRIEIGWGTFIVGGVLTLVIALVTVSTQAIKAALANPVNALRYE